MPSRERPSGRPRPRAPIGSVVGLLALVVLSACGSDGATSADDPSPSASGSASTSESASESATTDGGTGNPECPAVWATGLDLPENYRGCTVDGEAMKPDRHFCEFGLPIFTFDNRYYAVPGGPVNDVGDLATSKQYKRALRSCQG